MSTFSPSARKSSYRELREVSCDVDVKGNGNTFTSTVDMVMLTIGEENAVVLSFGTGILPMFKRTLWGDG